MKESNPEVGSSQNMSGGSVRISAAKDKRFISPPEIPFIVFILLDEPAKVFRHFVNPN